MGCICAKESDYTNLEEPLLKEGESVPPSKLSPSRGEVDSSSSPSPVTSLSYPTGSSIANERGEVGGRETHSNNSLSPLSRSSKGAGSNTTSPVKEQSPPPSSQGEGTDSRNEAMSKGEGEGSGGSGNPGGERLSAASNLTNIMSTLQKGTFVFNSKHAFKKVQKHRKGTSRFTLHKQLQTMLSSGGVEMFDIVKLPPDQDRSEWIAVHIVDFYNEVCLLYGCIVDECTQDHCPAMTAGRCTYLWADGKSVKKPQKVPAKQYVDYLMTWIEEQISSDAIYTVPTTSSGQATGPGDIPSDIKSIFKRLFRVYAHLYHKHFPDFEHIKAESHLNTCFERYIYFTLEFELVEEKELEPMKELIDMFQSKKQNKLVGTE